MSLVKANSEVCLIDFLCSGEIISLSLQVFTKDYKGIHALA